MSSAADLAAATEVFTPDASGRAVAFFAARRRPCTPERTRTLSTRVTEVAGALADAGWDLSVAGMFGDETEPTVYEAGAMHDVDVIGAFEGPGMDTVERGVTALEDAGWSELFATSWVLGPREYLPVPTAAGREPGQEWCFFALWEWNDAWQASNVAERRTYDLECDEAFSFDVASGVSIAGRHRIDLGSSWHHLGIWEVASPDIVDRAMQVHERVADFKFTTSRHYLGRRRRLDDYLGAPR